MKPETIQQVKEILNRPILLDDESCKVYPDDADFVGSYLAEISVLIKPTAPETAITFEQMVKECNSLSKKFDANSFRQIRERAKRIAHWLLKQQPTP